MGHGAVELRTEWAQERTEELLRAVIRTTKTTTWEVTTVENGS